MDMTRIEFLRVMEKLHSELNPKVPFDTFFNLGCRGSIPRICEIFASMCFMLQKDCPELRVFLLEISKTGQVTWID